MHLFFILSAFSLYYSTESRTNNPNWIREFYVKRFFRIAPLFYFIILFEITRQIIFSGRIVTDFGSIFLNFTFTFGFVPSAGLVWAGWAVGVEMIFYAILPILILTIRTYRSALIILAISIMVSSLIRSALHAQHITLIPQPRYDWSYYAFTSNICFFAMGICAYHMSRVYNKSTLANRLIPFLAVIILSGLMFFDVGKYFKGNGRWDIVIWGLGLTGLCFWQRVSPSIFIANSIFEYLGERSFSVYLLHPIILVFTKSYLVIIYKALQPYLGANSFFVCAILVVALVLVFAEFTYRLIEVPGIRLGRKLIAEKKNA